MSSVFHGFVFKRNNFDSFVFKNEIGFQLNFLLGMDVILSHSLMLKLKSLQPKICLISKYVLSFTFAFHLLAVVTL